MKRPAIYPPPANRPPAKKMTDRQLLTEMARLCYNTGGTQDLAVTAEVWARGLADDPQKGTDK